MLKILFNNDGSINTLLVGESIQQGNNNVNQVFAAIKDAEVGTYTCSAEFQLPNGNLVELVGVADQQDIGEITNVDGFTISLAESVTYLAGNLKMNLKLIDLQDNVLCTYQTTLKVNPTGYQPNETTITEAQYNSLLQSLNSYLLIVDYSDRIANYYTKDEADAKFIDTTEIQNYYTKSEVESYVSANYIDNTEIQNYYTKSETNTLLNGKQDTLIAGAGVSIAPDGKTISATTKIALSGPYDDLADLESQHPTGEDNTIYLITDPNAVPNNQYDEYIWTGTAYEKIASIDTALNLSDYVKKYSIDSTQWDTTPTQNSTKPITSGGVYSALLGKLSKYTYSYSQNKTINDLLSEVADADKNGFLLQYTSSTNAVYNCLCKFGSNVLFFTALTEGSLTGRCYSIYSGGFTNTLEQVIASKTGTFLENVSTSLHGNTNPLVTDKAVYDALQDYKIYKHSITGYDSSNNFLWNIVVIDKNPEQFNIDNFNSNAIPTYARFITDNSSIIGRFINFESGKAGRTTYPTLNVGFNVGDGIYINYVYNPGGTTLSLGTLNLYDNLASVVDTITTL